jgi:hypothetical protein
MFRAPVRFLPTCLVLAATVAVASAVVRRHDTADALYRRLGNSAAFASVGRVEIDYGRGFQAIGTATLYGADRVVSAAHVFDASSLSGAQAVRINFGRGRVAAIDFTAPGVVNIHPAYNSFTLFNDVSVVFLPPSFSLNPARLYHGRALARESAITFVGFGDTGTGITGSRTFSSAKRAGRNLLGSYFLGGRTFEVDFDDPDFPWVSSLGGRSPIRLEGLLGPGDSGGSVWIRRGTRWFLIGINSYGVDWYPNGRGNGVEDDYGDRSGFVYLPRYYAWLNALVSPY